MSYCFSADDFYCSKGQIIDLWKNGFAPGFLDKLQPKIIFGEWISNHNKNYYLTITLLNEKSQVIIEDQYNNNGDLSGWKKIHREITEYGPGVRYIKFYHAVYITRRTLDGTKITGSYLRITL